MSQKSKEFNQSAKPAHRTTSGSEAVRCEGEVEKDLTDALHQSVSSSQGTPPSSQSLKNKMMSDNLKVCY